MPSLRNRRLAHWLTLVGLAAVLMLLAFTQWPKSAEAEQSTSPSGLTVRKLIVVDDKSVPRVRVGASFRTRSSLEINASAAADARYPSAREAGRLVVECRFPPLRPHPADGTGPFAFSATTAVPGLIFWISETGQ